MGDLINLNKARKARARVVKKNEAEQNRILYGTPLHDRKLARDNEAMRLRRLEEQRRTPSDDSENS